MEMEITLTQQENSAMFYQSMKAELGDTDMQLVARIQARDRDALEILYDRHAAKALGVAYQILFDYAQAENVIVEAYWWVWKYSSLVQEMDGEFSTWFYRTVQHMAVTERNRQIPAPLPDP